MEGNQNASQGQMGLNSFVGYLSDIANNTGDTNTILNSINGKLDAVALSIQQTSVNMMKKTSSLTNMLLSKMNSNLSIITDKLSEFLRLYIEHNSARNVKDFIGSSVSSTQKISDKNLKFDKDGFSDLVSSITNLSERLSEDFVNRFDKFVSGIEKLNKVTKGATISILAFGASLLALSFFTFSADLLITVSVVGIFIKLVSWAVGNAKFPENALSFAAGMLLLSFALKQFEKVNISSIFRLGITMMFFGSAMKSTLSGGDGKSSVGFAILSFSAAMVIMAHTFKLYENIKWSLLFKIAIFMRILGRASRRFEPSKRTLKYGGKSWAGPANIIGFAIGLGLLGLVMNEWSRVKTANVMKVIATLFALSLVIFSMNAGIGGLVDINIFAFKLINRANPILSVAWGIAILTIALAAFGEVPINNVIFVIATIATIAIAVKMFDTNKEISFRGIKSKSRLFSFALGLAIVIITLAAIGEIDFKEAGKLLLFIGALGFVTKLFSAGSKGSIWALSFAIISIASAMWVISKVDISQHQLEIMAQGIIGLGLVIAFLGIPKVSNFIRVGSITMGMLGIAIGIAAWGINRVGNTDVDISTVFDFVKAIGVLGIMVAVLGIPKVTGFIRKGSLTMAILGVSIAIASWGLNKVSKTSVDLWQVGSFALAIAILALPVALMGIPKVALIIVLGSVALAILMGATYLAALTMEKISNLNIKFANIGWFLLAVGAITLGYSLLVSIMIPAALSALGVVLISASALLAAFVFGEISDVKIDFWHIGEFILSVGALALGYSVLLPIMATAALSAVGLIVVAISAFLGAMALEQIASVGDVNVTDFLYNVGKLALGLAAMSLIIAPAVIASIALLPVLLVSLLAAGTLHLISKVETDQRNLDNFSDGVKTLLKTVNSFGIIELGKAAIKSKALLPVFGALYLAGRAMKQISGVELSQTQTDNFAYLLERFTDVILETVSGNEKKLKAAKPGIEALAQLMNISGGLAKTITDLSNMYYNVYEVKDGILVIKERKKISEDEMLAVGQNFGKLIEVLVDPLAILGSEADTLNFNGKVVKNPFKSKQTMKGIETLEKISNAFQPLVEAISTFVGMEIFREGNGGAEKFRTDMNTIAISFSDFFHRIEPLKNLDVKKPLSRIDDFLESLKNFKVQQFEQLNNIVESFINKLSDDTKWQKIQRNIETLKKQFADIAKSINSIDIKKATEFQKSINLIASEKGSKDLAQAVYYLKELLDMVQVQRNVNQYTNPSSGQSGFMGGLFGSSGNTNQTNNNTDSGNNPQLPMNSEDKKMLRDYLASTPGILQEILDILGGNRSPVLVEIKNTGNKL